MKDYTIGDKAVLQRAIDSLGIADVYLREIYTEIADSFQPKYTQGALAVQHRQSTLGCSVLEIDDEEGTGKVAQFLVEAAVRFMDGSVTQEVLRDKEAAKDYFRAEIVARFVAEYKIVADVEKEEVEEFSKVNVLFHVWPYWRELLQSTCARMQLPQVVLPMLVLRNKKEDDAGPANAES